MVGTAWRAASTTRWSRQLFKTASAAKVIASTRCCTKLAKAASMSWLLLACWTMSFSPSARDAACVSLVSDSEAGFFGLTRSPITAAFGTSSWSNSSRSSTLAPITQCTSERRTAHGIVNASRAPSITNLRKRQNRFSRCDKESFRAGILIRIRLADAASARGNRRGLIVEWFATFQGAVGFEVARSKHPGRQGGGVCHQPQPHHRNEDERRGNRCLGAQSLL